MPSLVELGPVVLEKKFFKSCQFNFIISQLSPLWEGFGPSFEQTWIPFTQGCFVPSLVEIGSVVLEKNIFSSIYFLLFHNYLPLEKDGALHLNKLESPSPKNALCWVWIKLALCFWRRRFLKVGNLILSFPNYLPFGKGVALHLNKLESPSPKDALCQDWLKLAQWFWRRIFENFVKCIFTIS